MGFSGTISSEIFTSHSSQSEKIHAPHGGASTKGSFDCATDVLHASMAPLRKQVHSWPISNVEPRRNPNVLDMPQQAQAHFDGQSDHGQQQELHYRELQQAHALKIFRHLAAE